MVTPEESVPAKSDAYLYAQSAFFTQFNEVDFFVEDTDQESLYECIFGRLFPKLTVEQIFPLGSKTAVLEHAANNTTGRQGVYVLDKDFDDLLGTVSSLPRVVYLDRYCIENYVFEPNAVSRFIVSERPTETVASVERIFDVTTFLLDSILSLRSLFFHFFLTQKYALGIPNAAMSTAQFTRHGRSWLIDREKVRLYQRTVLAEKPGLIDFKREGKRYSSAFELNRRSHVVGQNISGKYLLFLLLRRISNSFNIPDTGASSATFRLAEYCTFRSLETVKHEITRSLKITSNPRSTKGTFRRAGVNRRRQASRRKRITT